MLSKMKSRAKYKKNKMSILGLSGIFNAKYEKEPGKTFGHLDSPAKFSM
jgi:hypothetical protein